MTPSELKKQFKLWWFRRSAEASTKPRTFIPLKKASGMGVLYDAEDELSQSALKKVETWATQKHIKIYALGFVNEKELSGAYTPHRYSDFFCLKHLSSMGAPLEEEFTRFLKEDMDYLLNLYCEPHLPLMGISSMSNARFRIGPPLEEYQFCFDAMIESKDKSLLSFTDEVLTFLTKFGDGTV